MTFPRVPRPGLPSSPWASRFGDVSHHYEENGVVHSALAPAFPRIDDPKYYAIDNPTYYTTPGINYRQPPGNKELDKVFWHEETQKSQLWGLETWEAAVLNKRLHFGDDIGPVSSGHTPWDRDRIGNQTFECYARWGLQVDESKWLPFLRKERWFDYVETPPGGRRERAGKLWSVDDPAIWDTLKPVLELTNRMLEALIKIKMRGYCICTIFIDLLSDKDLCLGELCTIQVNAAVTMVHEFMHAIIQSRCSTQDKDYAGNLWDPSNTDYEEEPFLDAGGEPEAGRC
ncbi:hypothetical protein F5Y16DRAFT_4889 [Xylariaceae sp. FL0255]|nr:hypothetical protein F5Y16DRAFT_4889 [Xylariaceae sp. FL0255]